MTLKIVRFYPKEASDGLWEKYFRNSEAIYKEGNPRDKLPSRKLEKSFMKDHSSDYDIYRWIIYNEDNSRVIGYGNLWHENEKSPYYANVKDKVSAYIAVAKDQRRKGIATNLLKVMMKHANSIKKLIIRAEINSESAINFCKAYDGKLITERALNRLYLDDIDWNLLDDWRTNSKARQQSFNVEVFEAVPKKDLKEFCKVYTNIWNLAPAEDIHGEIIITPEKRRADEALYREKNCKWITIIARNKKGTIAGLTEAFYNEENPDFLEQELTGVLKEYQGKGLGKWLKAEMLFYLSHRFPKATYIQTGNNNRNAPMLSINTRMGFKVYKKQIFFEFNLKKLLAKLEI